MNTVRLNSTLPSSEGFVALRKQADWGNISRNQAEGALEQSLCGVTAFDGDMLIGMARVIGDGILNLYIQDVIVAKSYRGLGVGKQIIEQLIADLGERFPPTCSVGLMAAKGQSTFYESFGFDIRPSDKTDVGMQSSLSQLYSHLAKSGRNA